MDINKKLSGAQNRKRKAERKAEIRKQAGAFKNFNKKKLKLLNLQTVTNKHGKSTNKLTDSSAIEQHQPNDNPQDLCGTSFEDEEPKKNI